MDTEDIWRHLSAENQHAIPAAIRPWLIETGSLTAKIKRLCTGKFSVELLDQKERLAKPHEQDLLQLSPEDSIIVRQVYLYCDTHPVVYARSLIPTLTLKDRFSDLENLGTQPLGEKIFSDPQLERSPIEWITVTQESAVYGYATQALSQKPDALSGRRSLFYGAAKPILISEYFLPDITSL